MNVHRTFSGMLGNRHPNIREEFLDIGIFLTAELDICNNI